MITSCISYVLSIVVHITISTANHITDKIISTLLCTDVIMAPFPVIMRAVLKGEEEKCEKYAEFMSHLSVPAARVIFWGLFGLALFLLYPSSRYYFISEQKRQ